MTACAGQHAKARPGRGQGRCGLYRFLLLWCTVLVAALPAGASAATPRQMLANAAFLATDKNSALTEIRQADAAAAAILATQPNDREAQMVSAMATGYSARLTRSRGKAMEARKMLEALAASDPRDPEAQAAIGAWHIDSIVQIGGMLAGPVLGANKTTGLAALDRAVALGGNRAMFPGLAAMLRLALDSKDKRALELAEAASRGTTNTALDKVMQRGATALLQPLRAGDTKTAQALARRLLPFGRIE